MQMEIPRAEIQSSPPEVADLRPLQFAEKGRRGKDNSPRGRYLKQFTWDSRCSSAGSQSYPIYCEYLHCKVRQEEFQSLRPAGLTHHFLSHHLQEWLKVYLPWPFLINLRDNFPHLLLPQFAAQGPHGYLPKEKTDPCLCANQTETKRERCLKQATCKLRGKQNKTELFATLEIICKDNHTNSSSLCRHQSRAPPGLLTLQWTWAHGNRLHMFMRLSLITYPIKKFKTRPRPVPDTLFCPYIAIY